MLSMTLRDKLPCQHSQRQEGTARPSGRNQNETLCVLRASTALTQRAQGISVTSVLKLFWARRTRRHYWLGKESSRADKKFGNSSIEGALIGEDPTLIFGPSPER
jgi:hypothetical protein